MSDIRHVIPRGASAPMVAFVGPLPPPLHGFSSICAMMLEILRARLAVDIYDRAPRLRNRLMAGVLQSFKPLRYFAGCVARRNMILYLALSGGSGQIIDLGYVLLSRLFRRRIFVHHHSFAYINAPSRLNRLMLSLLREDTHIVLGRQMGEKLAQIYGVETERIRVVSNAAFYAAPGESGGERSEAEPLHIGFLSNITFEKGFVEFFAILQHLKSGGIAYRAHVAGPVAPLARDSFDRLMAETADVHYLGPLYGLDKDRFYQQLDVFVFPTDYANEAEPLVIYEAMRCGVYVIACGRGAIGEMLGNGAGLTFGKPEIVESAVRHLTRLSRDRGALRAAQQLSLQQAKRMRCAGLAELDGILARMQGAACKQNWPGLV